MSFNVSTEKSDFDDFEYIAFVDGGYPDEAKEELFHRADEADMPMFWIDEKRKYGQAEVDFITASPYCLNDDAAEMVKDIGHEYGQRAYSAAKPHQKPNVWISGWDSVIGLRGAPIGILRDWVLEIAPIIFDRDNWWDMKSETHHQTHPDPETIAKHESGW